MAKIRGKPAFTWPAELAEFDSERYPSDWTALCMELRWHLDRCRCAAQAGRKDLAFQELIAATPSLRRKGSGDAGPVVIVEPPTLSARSTLDPAGCRPGRPGRPDTGPGDGGGPPAPVRGRRS